MNEVLWQVVGLLWLSAVTILLLVVVLDEYSRR